MNPWVMGFCIGFNVAAIAGILMDRHYKPKYAKLIDEAFVRGADLSVKNHAASIRREKHVNVHGYAMRCERCTQVFTALQSVRSEYVCCPTCDLRIPAPLENLKEVAK